MKRWNYLMMPALALGFLFTDCTNGPKTDEEIAKELDIEAIVNANLSGEQRSPESVMEDTVRVGGTLYHYSIHRMSSDDLPKVQGDYSRNAVFFDNVAWLSVKCGQREVYSHRFTKNDFAKFVDADMMRRSILEGLVYDHAIEGGLQFAAAVGYPQDDDMFVPLLIKVMTSGEVRIEKDPLNDSASAADILPDEDDVHLKDEDAGV